MLERFLQAVTKEDAAAVDVLLSENPGLIEKPNGKGHNLFFKAASHEKFKILSHLTTHPLFQRLPLNRWYEVYRDIIAGFQKTAKILNIKESKDQERLIAIRVQSIAYNQKIINKSDDDYYRLGTDYYSLGKVYSESQEDAALSVIDVWENAIRAYKKLENKYDEDYLNIAVIFNRLAVLQSQRQNLNKALSHLKEALFYFQNMPHLRSARPGLYASLLNNLDVGHGNMLKQEARRLACECKAVDKEDGNSLYYAIQDQLSLLDPGPGLAVSFTLDDFHRHMPKDLGVVQYLRSDLAKEFESYIDRLIQEQIWTWPQAIQILQISRSLNMTLVFIRSDGERPIVIKPENPRASLCLGLNLPQKYVSLRPRADWTPSSSIKDYIKYAPTGNSPKKENPPESDFFDSSSTRSESGSTASSLDEEKSRLKPVAVFIPSVRTRGSHKRLFVSDAPVVSNANNAISTDTTGGSSTSSIDATMPSPALFASRKHFKAENRHAHAARSQFIQGNGTKLPLLTLFSGVDFASTDLSEELEPGTNPVKFTNEIC